MASYLKRLTSVGISGTREELEIYSGVVLESLHQAMYAVIYLCKGWTFLTSMPHPLPQAKRSYLCLFTTSVYLWRKRRRKVSIFHKIGQFSFQVKSGNVTKKSFEKRKVLGISCFFSDNEFRKDDLPPTTLKKKNVYLPFCFPIQTGKITFRRSTFENGFWKRKPPTLKKLFSFLVNVILNFKGRI